MVKITSKTGVLTLRQPRNGPDFAVFESGRRRRCWTFPLPFPRDVLALAPVPLALAAALVLLARLPLGLLRLPPRPKFPRPPRVRPVARPEKAKSSTMPRDKMKALAQQHLFGTVVTTSH